MRKHYAWYFFPFFGLRFVNRRTTEKKKQRLMSVKIMASRGIFDVCGGCVADLGENTFVGRFNPSRGRSESVQHVL